MSSLSSLDKRKLEDLLGMRSGYVISSNVLSNRTFAEFFQERLSVDIYSGKYSGKGESKANHLRSFWELESDNRVGEALSAGRQADPLKCRELFLALISKTPTGVVEISSCGVGETAGDEETRGGRYSSSLITSADMWEGAEANKPSWSSVNSASIVASHSQAAAQTQRSSGGTQNPTIAKPRSGDYFPFTVFAS